MFGLLVRLALDYIFGYTAGCDVSPQLENAGFLGIHRLLQLRGTLVGDFSSLHGSCAKGRPNRPPMGRATDFACVPGEPIWLHPWLACRI